MADAGYSLQAPPVALVAATAKTAVFVVSGAQFGMSLLKIRIGCDGVTAGAVPLYWEICASTAATNSTPGTNNTTATALIQQAYGVRIPTTGWLAGYNCTTEPTVQTSVDGGELTVYSSLLVYDIPLGNEYDNVAAAGFGLRFTAPAAVNVRPTMIFKRI